MIYDFSLRILIRLFSHGFYKQHSRLCLAFLLHFGSPEMSANTWINEFLLKEVYLIILPEISNIEVAI